MFRKTLLAAVAAVGLMATPALASLNQFYHVQSGQWSIEGYTGDKNFCSAKSYWNDGSYVSLFTMRGDDTFSFMVHNNAWNIEGSYGAFYDGSMIFTGKAGADSGDAPFELRDTNTIVFRDITKTFLVNWIKYRTMTIDMPNDIQDMNVGLSGTADATRAFVDCIDHLNN